MAFKNKMSLSLRKNTDQQGKRTVLSSPIKKSEISGYESSSLSCLFTLIERNPNQGPVNLNSQDTTSPTFWKVSDDEFKSGSLSKMFESNTSLCTTSRMISPPDTAWSKVRSEKVVSLGPKSNMNLPNRAKTSRSFNFNSSKAQWGSNSSLSAITKVARREHKNYEMFRAISRTQSDDTLNPFLFPHLRGKQVIFQVQRLRADDHRQSVDQLVKDADDQQFEFLSDTMAIWLEFIEHGITSLVSENQLLEQIVETLEEQSEEKEDTIEDLVDDYLLHTKQLQLQEVCLTIARENLSEAFSFAREHDFKAVFLDDYIKLCAWTIDSGVRVRSHWDTVLLVKLSETEVQCSIPKHNSYKHLVFIAEQYSDDLPEEFFFWSEALVYAVRDDHTLKQALCNHARSVNTNSGYLELNVEPMHLLKVCLNKMATTEQNPNEPRSLFLPFDSKELLFKVVKVNKLHGNSYRTIHIDAKNFTIKIIKKNSNSRQLSSKDIANFKWESDAWRGKFTLSYFWKGTEKNFTGVCDECHVRRLYFCLHRYVLSDHHTMGSLTPRRQNFDFPEDYGDSNPQIQNLFKWLQENKWMCFCCRVLHQVMVDQLIEDGWVEHDMIRSFKMLSTSTRDKIEKVVQNIIRLLHWVGLTLVPIRSKEGYQRKGDQMSFWTDLSLECLGMSPHLNAMLPMLAEGLHSDWRKRVHGHGDALLRKDNNFKYEKWMGHFHELDQDGTRYFGTLAVSTLKALLVGHRVKEIEFKMNVEP